MIDNEDNVCDESKCRSGGLSLLSMNENNKVTNNTIRFDCYTKSLMEPLLCADEYIGWRVNKMIGEVIINDNSKFDLLSYYTCCPKGYDDGVDRRRHCSDPVLLVDVVQQQGDNKNSTTDDDDDDGSRVVSNGGIMPCHYNDIQKYPRRMAMSAFYPKTYICCDFPINNDTVVDIITTTRLEDVQEDDEEDEEEDNDEENDEGGTHSNVTAVSDAATAFCDESKCISNVVSGYYSYSCLGQEGIDTLFSFRCDDGYKGIIIDTEYAIWDTFIKGSDMLIGLSYYTCCRPPSTSEFPVPQQELHQHQPQQQQQQQRRRHCSNPIVLEKEEEDTGEMEMLCDDNDLTTVRALKFERNTTIRQANDQYRRRAYVCCDEDLTSIDIIPTTANKNFLDEVDCIPVCSEDDVNDCIVNNKYGLLYPMTCENDVFRYPHILHTQPLTIEGKGTREYTLFECCKTPTSSDGGVGGDGPFIQDCVFNITVWPQIVISSIALICCVILITGILSSILKKQIIEIRRRRLRSRQTTTRRGQQQQYNGYNFYLVLLAIPEIVLNVFIVQLYGRYANQKYSPEIPGYVVMSFHNDLKIRPLDTAVLYGCSTAILWLNGVVAHSIFTLLKNSYDGIRVKPPSIRKATIQATVIYTYGAIMFLIHYYLAGGVDHNIMSPIYFFLSAGLPIIYLFYICFIIWYRGLLPSSLVLGGESTIIRELAFYFLRIILVFMLFWLPSTVLLTQSGWIRTRDRIKYYEDTDKYNELLYPIGMLLCSIQAIVSTGIALTKTDVRKSVLDLFTLSYCCCCRRDEDLMTTTNTTRRNGR